MTVEVANYNTRHISASKWREQDVFSTECTTTPGSSIVMNSTLSSLQTQMLLTFRPSRTKTVLLCLLCGHSATSAIPGMIGLTRSLALWVFLEI